MLVLEFVKGYWFVVILRDGQDPALVFAGLGGKAPSMFGEHVAVRGAAVD